jgi:hypothetical protein
MPTKDGKRLREQILEGAEQVEDEETGQTEWEVVSLARFLFISTYSRPTGDVDRPWTVQGDQRIAAEGMQGKEQAGDVDVCRHGADELISTQMRCRGILFCWSSRGPRQ